MKLYYEDKDVKVNLETDSDVVVVLDEDGLQIGDWEVDE